MTDHAERMCQQPRCRSREPAILAKPVVAQTPPALWVATPGDASLPSREPVVQALLSGPKGVLGGGSIENQVARLTDTACPAVSARRWRLKLGEYRAISVP